MTTKLKNTPDFPNIIIIIFFKKKHRRPQRPADIEEEEEEESGGEEERRRRREEEEKRHQVSRAHNLTAIPTHRFRKNSFQCLEKVLFLKFRSCEIIERCTSSNRAAYSSKT